MTKPQVITELRQSNISNEALIWLLEALKEAPEQTNPLDPFEGAPEWARFRVADEDGMEAYYEIPPLLLKREWCYDFGRFVNCPDRRLTYSDWKCSMVEREKP